MLLIRRQYLGSRDQVEARQATECPEFFRDAIKDPSVEVLPIIDKHAIEFDYADSMYRDPFDNL